MSKLSTRAMIVAAAGVTAVAAIVALVLLRGGVGQAAGSADRPTLAVVAQADIANAATSLTQAGAATLVEDAKRCNIPLAFVTVSKGTAGTGSTVRIKSGSYVSPYFLVADVPLRIAIPFPAPYGSGSGTLTVDGNAGGAIVGLSPRKVLAELPGSQSIPVTWRARNPC